MLTLCLMLGLMMPGSDATAPPSTTPADTMVVRTVPAAPTAASTVDKAQETILTLINETRTSNGVAPVKWDNKLAEAARLHAERMADTGELSHEFIGEDPLMQRLTSLNVYLDRAGENVVYDQTPEGAHDSFMGSAPHRENILNAGYNAVGIGVIDRNGVLYVCEDFAHLLVKMSDDDAVQAVSKTFLQMRSEYQTGGLRYVKDDQLATAVQVMAQQEKPNGPAAMQISGARVAAAYATTDPRTIPPQVAQLAKVRGVKAYSVAVVYARTPTYQGGLYWVSILLYSHAPATLTAQVQ